jgi:hypothetical protein
MRAHTITTRPAVLLSLLALGALGLLVGGGAGQSAAAIPAATPPATQAITTVETTITKRTKTTHGIAGFKFIANQPGATFECAVDPSRPGHRSHQPFHPCASPYRVKVGFHPPRTHVFAVRATVGGVTDATPAWTTWKIVG